MRDEYGRFKPGTSGNPNGRPKCSRHSSTLAALALLEGEAEGLSRKAIELALAGDLQALRLCMERIAPVAKEHAITAELPGLSSAASANQFISVVGEQLAKGDLLPSQAATLSALAEQYRKHLETDELEHRIALLEEQINEGKI